MFSLEEIKLCRLLFLQTSSSKGVFRHLEERGSRPWRQENVESEYFEKCVKIYSGNRWHISFCYAVKWLKVNVSVGFFRLLHLEFLVTLWLYFSNSVVCKSRLAYWLSGTVNNKNSYCERNLQRAIFADVRRGWILDVLYLGSFIHSLFQLWRDCVHILSNTADCELVCKAGIVFHRFSDNNRPSFRDGSLLT